MSARGVCVRACAARSVAHLLDFARKNSKIGLPAELDASKADSVVGPDEWEL